MGPVNESHVKAKLRDIRRALTGQSLPRRDPARETLRRGAAPAFRVRRGARRMRVPGRAGGAPRHRDRVDRRELERRRQRPTSVTPGVYEDLGDLRAAECAVVRADRGERGHRARAVRVRAKRRRRRRVDARARAARPRSGCRPSRARCRDSRQRVGARAGSPRSACRRRRSAGTRSPSRHRDAGRHAAERRDGCAHRCVPRRERIDASPRSG